MPTAAYQDYGFRHPGASHMHARFMPHLLRFAGQLKPDTRVLDVGCGNGYTCGEFIQRGCQVVGVDLSEKGIELARANHPEGRFEIVSAEADIINELGEWPFDIVISTEVVEHLYSPRRWAAACFHALKPAGCFICTTPYHGYLKNLVIALRGRTIKHADPLWDGGHIKLWDKPTLSALLREAGFVGLKFRGVGRLPLLWMTMVCKAVRPNSQNGIVNPVANLKS